MRWPCPYQVEIIFCHAVIGTKPHKDQNNAQQAGKEEKQTVKTVQESLGKFAF